MAADEFNFMNSETEELTERGQLFALAKPEERPALLLEAILEYEPYELLLEAIFDRDEEKETSLEWIETWWSTQGYGSSGTNRNDASTTFARFCEYAQLGSYLIGRHGKPSRIEWDNKAADRIEDFRSRKPTTGQQLRAEVEDDEIAPQPNGNETSKDIRPSHRKSQIGEENNHFSLSFSGNKHAELSLPAKLLPEEKKRLVDLVELMVADDEEPDKPMTQRELDF